jgi:hypothetical protein
MTAFSESLVEQAALAWLEASGWHVAHGPGNGAALGPTTEHWRTPERHGQQREARR